MKKANYFIYLLCLAALTVLVSCTENIATVQSGWLQINKPLDDSLVHTRTTTGEIDYFVAIAHDGEVVMAPTLFSTIDGEIPLAEASDYILTAENCTPAEAESQPTVYGQPRYVGTETFDITANTSTNVTVHCAMANAAFKVQKDTSFYYSSYVVTATCNERCLTFTDEETMGYFNVATETTTTLNYDVVATDADGNTGRGSGSLQLKARQLSKLTLKANSLGVIELSINYDDTFTPTVHEIVLED